MAERRSLLQTIRDTVEALLTPESLQYVSRSSDVDTLIPSQAAVEQIIDLSRAVIFPGYFGDKDSNTLNLPYLLGINVEKLARVLRRQIEAAILMAIAENGSPSDRNPRAEADRITAQFIESLPQLRKSLSEDAEAIYVGDPAALSVGEIIYSYPAIRAVSSYRVAHRLHQLGVPVIPRMICERAHRETGIDIHPAATIGRAFMIDHGTGVVIGETSVIGDYVRIYQGVTLGARSFPVDENNRPVKGLPRHPIIGDNVVIYANSTILGRITIGSGSVIGGNIWITEDIAPDSIVLQARANNTIHSKNRDF